MTERLARAYWALGQGRGELREERVSSAVAADSSLIQADWSGVSVGTERLVGQGLVPVEAQERMRGPGMEGTFAFPVKYGYALVGRVITGVAEGQRVFALHPHQDWAVVTNDRIVAIPTSVPGPRATLLANLETALNAVWEAEPHPARGPLVVGAGAVGLLVAYVLMATTGKRATILEANADRRARAAQLPWASDVRAPADLIARAHDVSWHTSGTSEGLNAAVRGVGFEGRVIELSWYGRRSVEVEFGGSFHFDRKRIFASQVGVVAPSRRGSVPPAERRRAAVALLMEPALDQLLTPPIPFAALPNLMARLYRGEDVGRCPLVEFAHEAR